ncbi:MAG: hypothetical protein ILP18_03775 [Treponema sp.]|nr:hypothetical protein [Treponema sp.]
MAYKIAVASSDASNVDVHFGAAGDFLIYNVADDGSFSLAEKRSCPREGEENASSSGNAGPCGRGCGGGSAAPCGGESAVACGSGSDGTGSCSGQGNGCGHAGAVSAKVQLVSDCRCVVAAKIGFNVTKQLEKKAISGFDVECPVQEALEKITKYFHNVDNHVSLARRRDG